MSDERLPKDDLQALPKGMRPVSRFPGQAPASLKQAFGMAERDWGVDPEAVRQVAERLQSEGLGMEGVKWVDQSPKQQEQQQEPEQAAPEEDYGAGY